MSGTILAACAASAPIPGTDDMCPDQSAWIVFGSVVIVLYVGCILYLTVTSLYDLWRKRRNSK